MNIIRDGLMSICAILYFMDFVYILRNKKFLFFEEAATMFDAWLSFFVSVTALFITISNIMSDEPGDYFVLLIIIIIIVVSRRHKKSKSSV